MQTRILTKVVFLVVFGFEVRVFKKFLLASVLFGGVYWFSGCASSNDSSELESVAQSDSTVLNDENQSILSNPKPLDGSEPAPSEEIEKITAEATRSEPAAQTVKIEEPAPRSRVAPERYDKPKAKEKHHVAKSTAKSSGKGLFKTTRKNCKMRSKPKDTAKVLTQIPKGRKIWVEKSGSYYKAFRSETVGYLSKTCF